MREDAVQKARPLALVVDDDPTLRLLGRESLEQAGFAVQEAADGAQALSAFQRSQPDIVLLDVLMPEMDGFMTCAALRKLPGGDRVPVLMVTGLDDLASITRAYEVGATDFISKPLNWLILSQRVRYMLRASRAIDELRESQEALRQEAQVSAALLQVGRGLTSSLDTPVILSRLCQLTTQELGCDCSHILLWQPEEEVYVPVASWGDTPEQWEALRVLKIPSAAVASLPARLKHEVTVKRAAATLEFLPEALSREFGMTASLYLALRRGEDIIGIQVVGYRGRAASFTSKQQRIAHGIAQMASMALENAQLFEQAEDANRFKSDFVAMMSHELRNPLHIIMGYNNLLREGESGDLTDGQAQLLRQMEKSAGELLEIINTTLDVSRLEAGRPPIEVRQVNVAKLMKEVEAETRHLRENTALQFKWEVKPKLPSLQTDPMKLKVVLKNLISNAVKFTDEGSVTVDVQASAGGVEICVADTGVGIAPEELSVIFEPFRQVESSLTRRHDGVGLGLYIVRRILELLGGTIGVESKVGQGSLFRVWLPQKRAWKVPAPALSLH